LIDASAAHSLSAGRLTFGPDPLVRILWAAILPAPDMIELRTGTVTDKPAGD